MTDISLYQMVESKIIHIRGQNVILDSDVAELYGVETKRINEAVSRNPGKFPKGYLLELTHKEWLALKSQFATSIEKGGKTKLPTAFTEKGLYMLATILKSSRATQTTLSIIETFTKVRETRRVINQIPSSSNKPEYQANMQKAGELITDLIMPELSDTESTASIELNLALVKFKYSIKKKG